MRFRLFVTCLLFFILVFVGKPVFAKRYIRMVKIKDAVGTVKIWQNKQAQWSNTEPDMLLYPKDQIMTGPDSSVTIYFQDKSKIIIKDNSLITADTLLVDKNEESVRNETIFTVWSGKIEGWVSALKETDRFEIITSVSLCAVRGTHFSLAVADDSTTMLKVYEGVVGVKDSSGMYDEKLVTSGFQVSVQPDLTVSDPEPLQEEREEIVDKQLPVETAPPVQQQTEQAVSKPAEQVQVSGVSPGGYKIGKWVSITMNGSLGAVVLTDPETGLSRIFYKISFLPELAVWKIGVGFDLSFYYDETNKLRKEDWDHSDDILKKIWYVRFGQKGETVYAYCGGFPGVTIGHGFIMNNYTNMLRYPDERKIGALLDIDTGLVGFESVVTDVNQAEVFGARIYTRPLYKSGIPLFNRVAFGVSGITDRDPDSKEDTRDDSVTVYGVDAELPVFSNKFLSSMIYADVAQIDLDEKYILQGSSDNGRGFTTGVMGKVLFMNYRAEYRRFENNFIPSYFNPYYDIDRFNSSTNVGKADTISGDTEPILEGPYVELGVSLLSLIIFSASYEDYNKDPRSEYPWVHGEVQVDPRLLLNKFTFKASYDKRNANNWDEIKNVRGAIITAELGYHIAPRVLMVMVQRQTFDNNGKATKTVEIETRIQF